MSNASEYVAGRMRLVSHGLLNFIVLYHGFKGTARGVFQLYHGNTGFAVEYLDIPQEILWSHMTPTGQQKTIEMIYLPERRGESCESTSPATYNECASRPTDIIGPVVAMVQVSYTMPTCGVS